LALFRNCSGVAPCAFRLSITSGVESCISNVLSWIEEGHYCAQQEARSSLRVVDIAPSSSSDRG
jgi:hypothetical protein